MIAAAPAPPAPISFASEIARRLDVPQSTLVRWIERGLIQARHVGRCWLLDSETVAAAERLAEARRVLRGQSGEPQQ